MINAKSLKNAKKLIIFCAVLLIMAQNITLKSSAFAPDAEIYSHGVFMVNLDTDLTVFKKNEFETVYPASTTKIMTALVVLDNVSDLNTPVVVTNAMNTGFGENPNFTGAGVADFAVGQENLTYADCLYALMVHSACDAANILAYSVGGDIPTFVEMMNQKAAELGAVKTNFANPHGLHQKNNYSCAYDMFLITRHAYEKYPQFMEIANTTTYELPENSRNAYPYSIHNTNRLIRNFEGNSHFYEFARGVKTGSMNWFYDVDTGEYSEGNFCLVSTASRGGYTYMLVTLGAPFHKIDSPSYSNPPTDNMSDRALYAYDDHLSLYRWAFSTLEYQSVLSADDVISQVAVRNGQEADRVQLKPARDYNTLLPNNLDGTAILRDITLFDEEVEAPVAKGDVLGYVELKLMGETLIDGRIDLVAATDVQKSTTAEVAQKIAGIFSETWFKVGAGIIVVLIIFVTILRIMKKSSNKNRNNRKIRR
ncbi:MAG: D-alanyl-D-alanine carboxypeptidase [Oscillospiraceae bacterium]|nr:D-alanyl-D-alanine carboxypeptidase [Oscillospiraceae bacterium]